MVMSFLYHHAVVSSTQANGVMWREADVCGEPWNKQDYFLILYKIFSYVLSS